MLNLKKMFFSVDHIIISFFSFLGIMICLYQTSSFGIGVSPDSVGYISAARSILDGDGIKVYTGDYYVYWPPLFPILLAAFGFFGLDPSEVSRYLNAGIFGTIIILSGIWLLKNISNKGLIFFGVTLFSLSPALIGISVYAWSEPLFIFLILLWLNQITLFLNNNTLNYLVIAAIYVALATLTRHIGVIAIAASILLIIIKPNIEYLDKLKSCALFTLIASFPISLWWLRTWFVSNTLTGTRTPSDVSFIEAGIKALETLSGWLIPSWTSTAIRIPFLTLFLLMFLIVLISRVPKKFNNLFICNAISSIQPHIIFLIMYTLFITLLASSAAFDPLGDRLLSPIYISFWFLTIYTLDRLLNIDNFKKIKPFIVVLFGLWVAVYPARSALFEAEKRYEEGEGYASKEWREDTVLNFIKTEKIGGLLYSNVPEATYYLIGINSLPTPRKYQYQTRIAAEDLTNLIKTLKSEKTHLAWFNRKKREYLFSLEEIKKSIKLKPIFESSDGGVYNLTPEDLKN